MWYVHSNVPWQHGCLFWWCVWSGLWLCYIMLVRKASVYWWKTVELLLYIVKRKIFALPLFRHLVDNFWASDLNLPSYDIYYKLYMRMCICPIVLNSPTVNWAKSKQGRIKPILQYVHTFFWWCLWLLKVVLEQNVLGYYLILNQKWM